jgi:hypothetical protein
MNYEDLFNFIIENFDLFFDKDLYASIIYETEKEFNIVIGPDFQNVLLEMRNILLDHAGVYGGINLFTYTIDDLLDDYRAFFNSRLSDFEINILETFLEKVAINDNKFDIVDYLRYSSGQTGVSSQFAAFLIISADRAEVFANNFPDLHAKDSIIFIGEIFNSSNSTGSAHQHTWWCMSLHGPCLPKVKAHMIPSAVLTLWVNEIKNIISEL